ncbi:MAG TPA: hypothetical protein VFR67_17625, partial [Pilimelia sp.]|nr:hypothetical protein [Pilimelia sp.]
PATAEPALRRLAQAYGDAQVSASDPVPWDGAAADAFAAHRGVLVAHLAQGEESLSGRLAATAGYADALAGWMAQTRAELARALAAALGSTQAVSIVAGPLDGPVDRLPWARAVPAADIAARVLCAVVQAYDRADELRREWAPRLTELPWRPAAGTEPVVRTGAGPRLGR